MGYQLGEPGRVQQARGNAAGEARPAAGEERQARPQRIARRRVGIVGRRIEKEIGSAITRQSSAKERGEMPKRAEA